MNTTIMIWLECVSTVTNLSFNVCSLHLSTVQKQVGQAGPRSFPYPTLTHVSCAFDERLRSSPITTALSRRRSQPRVIRVPVVDASDPRNISNVPARHMVGRAVLLLFSGNRGSLETCGHTRSNLRFRQGADARPPAPFPLQRHFACARPPTGLQSYIVATCWALPLLLCFLCGMSPRDVQRWLRPVHESRDYTGRPATWS